MKKKSGGFWGWLGRGWNTKKDDRKGKRNLPEIREIADRRGSRV
jgi:hypothetical protein